MVSVTAGLDSWLEIFAPLGGKVASKGLRQRVLEDWADGTGRRGHETGNYSRRVGKAKTCATAARANRQGLCLGNGCGRRTPDTCRTLRAGLARIPRAGS